MLPLSIVINKKKYPVLELPKRPRALLDRSVADIYCVETGSLNRTVARKPKRFPEDFCFQLTRSEAKSLSEQTQGQLSWSKGHLPKAFTHVGCNMLAMLMDSDIAIERSLQIIRAFTALENQVIPSTEAMSVGVIEILRDLKKYLGDSNFIMQQLQAMSSQMITLGQEVSKMNERVNILETRIDALMKARGNFNENHWLFGKFTEIVAEEIDENRGQIKNLESKLEKLTQQKSKKTQKNSKIEKK